MKTRLLKNALIIATLFVASYSSAQATYNDAAWDFELDSGVDYKNGTADVVTAWTQTAGFVQSSEQAQTGTYSCKMDFTSTATSGKFQTWRANKAGEGLVDIPTDESYTATLWVYIASGTPSGALSMSLQKSGETTVTAVFQLAGVPLNTWTELQVPFNNNPAVVTGLWSSLQFNTVPDNSGTASGAVIYIDNVDIVQSSTLSVKENTLEGVSVFPNPATDRLTVNTLQGGHITIYNALGALVKEEEAVFKNHIMNIADLTSGLYVLKVNSKGKTFTKKLLIN